RTATSAATAMRHSKRMVRYTAITPKNTSSASRARLLTLSPQVGPTVSMLTLEVATPAYLASAAVMRSFSADETSLLCTRTPLLPTMSTLASVSPTLLSASRTRLADAEPCATVNCHCVPPSKSMPRLRPEIANAITEMRIAVPDRSAQRHERSMNWKFVRSW